MSDEKVLHFTNHIATKAPVCGDTRVRQETTFNEWTTTCPKCKEYIANMPEMRELYRLYEAVSPAAVEYGTNHYGTEIHTKLEEALQLIRERYVALQPSKYPNKLK